MDPSFSPGPVENCLVSSQPAEVFGPRLSRLIEVDAALASSIESSDMLSSKKAASNRSAKAVSWTTAMPPVIMSPPTAPTNKSASSGVVERRGANLRI